MELWVAGESVWTWGESTTATVEFTNGGACVTVGLSFGAISEPTDRDSVENLLVCQLFDGRAVQKVILSRDVPISVSRDDVIRMPNRMGVGFSGGGLRATGFQLGVLMGLNAVGLLGKIRHISGVSGGSLLLGHVLGAMIDGRSFAAFQDHVCRFLHEDLPIASVSGGSPILRAANYYDRTLPGEPADRTLGAARRVLCAHEHVNEQGWGLEEGVFNTTELAYIRDFVFAVSSHTMANAGPKSGTHEAIVSRNVVDGLRIADAMAASSAFPGGFGPIRFPADFVGADPRPFGKKTIPHTSPVALTDGGVHDNQGIHALLKAAGRTKSDFDWVVVVDADPGDGPPQLTGETPGWILHSTVPFVLGAAGLLTLTGMLVGKWAPMALPWLPAAFVSAVAALGLILGVLFLGFAVITWWARSRLPSAVTATPTVSPWGLLPAGLMRARVFEMLGSDAFMIRSRRLHYKYLFAIGRVDKLDFHPVAVLISALPKVAKKMGHCAGNQPSYDNPHEWKMSESLARTVEQAAWEGTTLRLGDSAVERRQRAHVMVTTGLATVSYTLWLWAYDAVNKAKDAPHRRLDPRIPILMASALEQLQTTEGALCKGCDL